MYPGARFLDLDSPRISPLAAEFEARSGVWRESARRAFVAVAAQRGPLRTIKDTPLNYKLLAIECP